MPFRHGKLSEVVLDSRIASRFFKSAETNQSIETHDTSAFGSSAKTYLMGQNDGTITLSGMYDGAVGQIDELFSGFVAAEGSYPVLIAYDGGLTVGRACRFASVKQTTYNATAPTSDIVSISAELQCDAGIKNGRVHGDAVARSESINFPTVDWGANSATTRGGRLQLHVPTNGRNVATSVKVQHSTDNSVWVDLGTQSVSAGQTAAFVVEVTGTVNRYTRVITTLTAGTGTITTIAAFARN